MTLASWIGLAGSALLFAAVAAASTRLHRRRVTVRLLIVAVLFIAALIPFRGLPISGYLRGTMGDLSVTTWILVVTAVSSKITRRRMTRPKDHAILMFLILSCGLLLYPSALGLTYVDTYALGYGSKWLLATFFAVSLITWYLEYPLATICLTTSVLAYSLQVFESRNLWDYWMDPLVTLYALWRSIQIARNRGTMARD